MTSTPDTEAARVTFRGMSKNDFPDPPVLGEDRRYSLIGHCVGVEQQERKDGEERLVVKMEVIKLWEGAGAPPADDEPSLYDDNGNPSATATGEGWETPADPDVAPVPGDDDFIAPGTPLQADGVPSEEGSGVAEDGEPQRADTSPTVDDPFAGADD